MKSVFFGEIHMSLPNSSVPTRTIPVAYKGDGKVRAGGEREEGSGGRNAGHAGPLSANPTTRRAEQLVRSRNEDGPEQDGRVSNNLNETKTTKYPVKSRKITQSP